MPVGERVFLVIGLVLADIHGEGVAAGGDAYIEKNLASNATLPNGL